MNTLARAAWLRLAVAAAALLAATAAQAQGKADAEIEAAFEAAKQTAVQGPSDVKLADQATLKLPEGFVYVPPDEGKRIMTAMGNRVGAGLLGLVFPGDDPDANWFVVMSYVDSGYIRDDDAKDWDADELLGNLKAGTEEANRDRKARGIAEMEVLGWVEAPRYDAAAHRLVWSAATKDKSEAGASPRGVNYNTYALGRQGYVSLNLVTDYASIAKDKPLAHRLLGALEFNTGRRYADFDSSTDRVAEYGLAALVGGFAAKKLGLLATLGVLLAKFWKVVAIAGVGLVAGLGKVLGRKKADGNA
ncbi:MAG TPA: DUF2167 domain-containing protein [Burkholderiales bacterium]|nr:DUF2167 domain-containing protein [Burkholderiales bacterium]